MRSPDDCSRRDVVTCQPTQRKQFARTFLWVAFSVGGLVLAGCGSDASENGATASGDDGTASGGQLDGETSDILADAQAELEELQESDILGSGSGVITIAGVDYSFDAKVCYSQDTGFEASGPGQTADGVPYWASLSTGVSTRAGMLESGLPEDNVDAFFGDRDSIESFTLEVELGKVDLFSSGDDSMPEFAIDVFDIADAGDLSYTVDGATMSGSGSVVDDHGVALEYNESAPVTFSASCE